MASNPKHSQMFVCCIYLLKQIVVNLKLPNDVTAVGAVVCSLGTLSRALLISILLVKRQILHGNLNLCSHAILGGVLGDCWLPAFW